jgi:hypothetical protein
MINSGTGAALLSIAMIGMFLLAGGGIMVVRRGDKQRGLLMLAVAVVVLANVLIWTV